MNQPIIVQQNIETPTTGPIKSKSDSQAGKQGKPVAAIIRPKSRIDGNPGSVRMDASSTVRSRPHIRSREFQEYVQWLQAKFQSDELDNSRSDPASEGSQAISNSDPVQIKPLVAEIVSTLVAAPGDGLPASLFSTITTATDVSHELNSPSQPNEVMDPIVATATERLPEAKSAKIDRSDEPHANLPQAYVSFDELKVGASGMPTIKLESSLAKSVPLTAEPTESTERSVEDADCFVSTISKAIASVLTETPEPEFEQKVRDLFESELQARKVDPTMLESHLEIEPSQLDPSPATELDSSSHIPMAELKPETMQATSKILTSARIEIPTSVAAWDVEDFRWPVVTNQMIVAGSEALDQLCQSTLEMVSPGNQRVAIAGLGRGEGTTSIALSLARWAVARGNNVLVIDADLVSPGLTTQVGLAPSLSWINAVSQSLEPSEVIVRSQKSNLCIMPLAQMVSRLTWPQFIYDSLGEMIKPIQSHFDLIILDVGPANQLMAELSRPSLLVDATLLVHNGVDSPEFQTTKSRLEMFGLNRFIVAQNRARQQSSANVA